MSERKLDVCMFSFLPVIKSKIHLPELFLCTQYCEIISDAASLFMLQLNTMAPTNYLFVYCSHLPGTLTYACNSVLAHLNKPYKKCSHDLPLTCAYVPLFAYQVCSSSGGNILCFESKMQSLFEVGNLTY